MRRLFGKVLLSACSVLVTLILLEIALRLVQPARPQRLDPQVHYIHVPCDPAVGRVSDYWYLAPNQDSYTFEAPVHSNALGLRNRDVSLERTSKSYRILTLGDSHTFGYAVPEEQTYPRLLENKLRQSAPGQSVEVINAGVEALSIEQEVQLYEERLVPLKPDLVILTYYWNDMPMVGAPDEPWSDGAEMIPATMNPQATSWSPPHEGGFRGLLKRSYLLYNIVQRVPYLLMNVYPTNETQWKRATLEGRTSARIQASWTFVERRIARLNADAVKNDFTLAILVVPLFEQMLSDNYPNAAYQTKLAQIGRAQHIEVIDPLPEIRASKPSYPRNFIPFDGHPNGLIYSVMANVAATRLSNLPRVAPSSKQRVDERRDRRDLPEDHQRAEEQQEADHRCEPPPLVLREEQQQLAHHAHSTRDVSDEPHMSALLWQSRSQPVSRSGSGRVPKRPSRFA
jgi:lysophospholipase L1-like esterase